MWRCGCGFDLRKTVPTPAPDASWVLAQLIEHRLDNGFRLSIPYSISENIIERLAALTLDGMFKTIWFLGYRLGAFERCTVGHGRTKHHDGYAERIIEQAFLTLASWPQSMASRLSDLAKRALAESEKNLYRRAFKPLSLYLEENLADRELSFLRLTYERQIRELWRTQGRGKLPAPFSQQQEFNF